jgi:hypothetical protein
LIIPLEWRDLETSRGREKHVYEWQLLWLHDIVLLYFLAQKRVAEVSAFGVFINTPLKLEAALGE